MKKEQTKKITAEIKQESLEQFQEYLKNKNLSPNTIASYSGSVRLFFRMHQDISLKNLKRYRSALMSHYKSATVNQRIHAINHFIQFLSETDEENFFYLKEYRLLSVKKQQKPFQDTTISNEDYELLKRRLKADGNDFWYFVVHFLAATGARVSELVQIKVEHLHHGYFDLYSKGGKIRRIYLPDSLCEEALIWCGRREQKSGFLFLNRRGQPISTRGIHSQLKYYALQYGIDPETVYPHSFRHRFAKNFLARFNDIALLADLMGHNSIETTRIYLTRTSREQRKLLDEIVTW